MVGRSSQLVRERRKNDFPGGRNSIGKGLEAGESLASWETARSSLQLEHGVGRSVVEGRRAKKGLGMGSSLWGQKLPVLGGPTQHYKG